MGHAPGQYTEHLNTSTVCCNEPGKKCKRFDRVAPFNRCLNKRTDGSRTQRWNFINEKKRSHYLFPFSPVLTVCFWHQGWNRSSEELHYCSRYWIWQLICARLMGSSCVTCLSVTCDVKWTTTALNIFLLSFLSPRFTKQSKRKSKRWSSDWLRGFSPFISEN